VEGTLPGGVAMGGTMSRGKLPVVVLEGPLPGTLPEGTLMEGVLLWSLDTAGRGAAVVVNHHLGGIVLEGMRPRVLP